jgi:predicted transcriptional regulator
MTTLTIKEAAEHFGVSERTIRRRIAAGELRASRAPMAQGYQVFVQVDTEVDHVDTTADKVDTDVDNLVSSALDVPVMAVVMDELDRVHTENQRLHDQTIQLAGQVGFLQAQLQQAQEQVRLLTDSQRTPEHPAPDAAPTPQAADQPAKRVPWWRKWFADI